MNGSESNEFTDRYGQALNITQCIARRHSDKLAKFLDQSEGSGGEQQAVGDLMRSARSCSGDKVRVSMKELRGAAAEALLKHIDTPDPASARSTNPNLEKDFYSSLPQGDSLQTVANCQVTQAPAAVRKYIDAAPGAQGSDKLNSDVVAASETCGDIGTKDPETAVLYRAYLAEALYRWSLAGGGKNSS